MKHDFEKHGPGNPCPADDGRSCHICDGGLSHCLRCGGAESSLPKECPGRHMVQKEIDMITAGHLDFVGGKWKYPPTSGEKIPEVPPKITLVDKGAQPARKDYSFQGRPGGYRIYYRSTEMASCKDVGTAQKIVDALNRT